MTIDDAIDGAIRRLLPSQSTIDDDTDSINAIEDINVNDDENRRYQWPSQSTTFPTPIDYIDEIDAFEDTNSVNDIKKSTTPLTTPIDIENLNRRNLWLCQSTT